MAVDTTLAILVALLATVFYAASSNLVRAGMGNSRTMGALFVSLSVNLAVLWPASLLLFDVSVDLWQWRYFVAAGALAPVAARFFNYSGIDRLGVNISTPLTYMYPFVSIVIAVPLLGESLPPLGMVGGALVILGGILLAAPDNKTALHIDDKKFLKLPLLAAVLYGTSQVLRKVGIDLVASPTVAGAVTATTSWIILVGYLAATRSFGQVRVNRREALLFGAAGLVTSLAIPLMYLAFSLGSVVVVTPITNVSPLFVLIFSYVLYRDDEPFTRRVIGGTFLIVVGLVLLARFSAAG